MSLLIAVQGWDAEPWRARMAAHFPNRMIHVWPEAFDAAKVEHAICWKPKPGLLASLPNLKAIYSLGAGVDHIFADPHLPSVPLIRVIDPDLTTRMSEWVVLNVLLHHRRTLSYLAAQRGHVWRDMRDEPAARDIRVGVMGMGVLGHDAALKLKNLGYDVAGWSRSGKGADGIRMFGAGERDAFLARTDILVVLLPLTFDTKGILNRELFARLARNGRLGGPVLLNAGRGGLQKEADIAAALKDGTLIAASLDVFEAEPLPEDSPLWDLPSLVITPHNAAESDAGAVSAFIARQIVKVDAGETPNGLVNRAAGY